MRACSRPILMAAAFIVAGLAGCASPPPANDPDAVAEYKDANDPLEPTNRVVYAITDGVDVVVLRPLALAYRQFVPQGVRDHTHNVLVNLRSPVVLANDMAEGNPRRSGDTMMRFLLNTSVGIGGIFDVATGWGWPPHDADAGITLALWGVPEGPYLFLPVLGPSNPRDGVGFGIDYALDPFNWIGQGTIVDDLGYARLGLSALDARERVLDDLDRIKKQALDPYATIRSLARQHRQAVIDDARAGVRGTPSGGLATPAQ